MAYEASELRLQRVCVRARDGRLVCRYVRALGADDATAPKGLTPEDLNATTGAPVASVPELVRQLNRFVRLAGFSDWALKLPSSSVVTSEIAARTMTIIVLRSAMTTSTDPATSQILHNVGALMARPDTWVAWVTASLPQATGIVRGVADLMGAPSAEWSTSQKLYAVAGLGVAALLLRRHLRKKGGKR